MIPSLFDLPPFHLSWSDKPHQPVQRPVETPKGPEEGLGPFRAPAAVYGVRRRTTHPLETRVCLHPAFLHANVHPTPQLFQSDPPCGGLARLEGSGRASIAGPRSHWVVSSPPEHGSDSRVGPIARAPRAPVTQ